MELTTTTYSTQYGLSYSSAEAEYLWSRKMNNARKIQDLEVIMVEQDHRLAGTVRVKKVALESYQKELAKRNLVFTPIHWVKDEQGFAHYHIYTSPHDKKAVCYGVVTKSHKEGDLFKKASEGKVDHALLGSFLGFPKCCIEFFREIWCAGYIDTVWHQALNSGIKVNQEFHKNKLIGYSATVSGPPVCVAMHRYWGVRVSFHLPCSFTCDATQTMAKKWLDVMNTLDPSVTRDVLDILSLPTTWAAHQGLAIIYTPHFRGHANSVACKDLHIVHFSCTVESKLHT